jgi:hypothetical protein
VKRITGNTVGDLASKLLVSAGTSMASEAGKRLASRFIAPPSSAPPTAPPQPPPQSQQCTAGRHHAASACSDCHPASGLAPYGVHPASFVGAKNAANHQAKLNEIMSKYAGSGVAPQQQLSL